MIAMMNALEVTLVSVLSVMFTGLVVGMVWCIVDLVNEDDGPMA
jgi:hypothetical protein